MATVLVVDDDTTVREVVVSYLRAAGHDVLEAADGESGLRLVTDAPPQARVDLVVLDIMLPGIDGREVCRRLRSTHRPALGPAVVMLSALGDADDRVLGLEVGADDYVSKPFSARELVLRVESVLRRSVGGATVPPEVLLDDDLVVDGPRHLVTLAGRPLALTGREFDLLRFFVGHPGVAFSREELLHQVWGWSVGDHSTVTVHVRRLREKVERDPATPARLLTVWGVGYRWQVHEPASAPDEVAHPGQVGAP
ncbi:MAG: response regulator transcription factor [Nocardioides sp.]|nr:response regulator transcription factor [Nocardioides sp.]